MPYRLVIDKKVRNTKENRYIDIDFLEKQVYSLEEINNFTIQFEDEEEFITSLLEKQTINIDMANLPIKIINAKNNQISFEPIFLNNVHYLDINNIISYFQNNCTNIDLIEKIYYSFGKRTEKYTNSEIVHRELSYYYNCLKKNIYYDLNDNRSINIILEEYLRKLCRDNPTNIQKIASMIIQNERRKDIQEDNSDILNKRLEHIRYLLENDTLSEDEINILTKEYDRLIEELNMGESRK